MTVDLIRPGPRPSSELCLPVVIHGLLYLCLGIHYEGTILNNRFLDGPPLQQEKMALIRAILKRYALRSLKINGFIGGNFLT